MWVTLLGPLRCGYCRDMIEAGTVAMKLLTGGYRCHACARRITTEDVPTTADPDPWIPTTLRARV